MISLSLFPHFLCSVAPNTSGLSFPSPKYQFKPFFEFPLYPNLTEEAAYFSLQQLGKNEHQPLSVFTSVR